MPWKAFLVDNEYCVFKLDDADERTGSSLGCHPSRVAANRQIAALNAAELDKQVKEESMSDENEMKENLDEKSTQLSEVVDDRYVPFGVISFEEFEALQDAKAIGQAAKVTASQFQEMVNNIFMREDIENKASAIADLTNQLIERMENVENKELDKKAVWSTAFVNTLPDSSFLFIEKGGQKDNEGKTKPRSLRHFPYKDASGKVDLPHIRNAIARIPQSTAKGLNKSALQAKARKILEDTQKEIEQDTWMNKAIAKFKEIMGIKEKEEKSLPSFSIWKNKETGQYQWLAIYSNNIIDKEVEIISSDSHKRFVERVDQGLSPLPELWLWHVKEWKFGNATNVAYDNSGFAIAMGNVDRNKPAEAVAKWLSTRDDMLTSHGMPPESVKRKENVLIEHETREISPLFNFAAANNFTGFHILSKEVNDMAIPQHKREEFIEQGLSAGVLDELESLNEVTDKETTEAGLEKKETETTQETAPVETASTEPQELTRQEVQEALNTLVGVIQPLAEQVKELADEVKELRQINEGAIPRASTLSASLEGLLSKDAQVDGRSSLAKSKPAEASAEESGFFLNQWLQPNIPGQEVR